MNIAKHYASGDLLERLFQALRDDGQDPENLSLEAMAPYDQFHGRGLDATAEIASSLDLSESDRILDIGSGLGGPARYLANRFGCSVCGIDLTPEFREVARYVTEKLGLACKVSFEEANALAMPFDDACFDGAYSMNVSMNIEDRAGLYREIHRVLKPGGWLLLSELALGPAGVEPDYPTPWAETAASSFLMTQPDTEAGLKAAGFTISRSDIMTPQAKAYGVKLKEIADRGGKSPSRAVELVHGEATAEIAPNMARAMTERRIVPIEIFCTKDSA